MSDTTSTLDHGGDPAAGAAAAPPGPLPAAAATAPAPPAPPGTPGTPSAGTPGMPSAGATQLSRRGWFALAALVGALAVASITLAIYSQQRLKALEQELVRRQTDSAAQVVEARALAKQANESAQSAEAKAALLEARVAETALQRSQLEDLIQQLSRSRDENVLADVEAAIRVAVQQSAITGSAEPLIGALRQAEERLARISQPRTERVRRALTRDLDRAKAVALTDVATLAIRLDEAVRLVDELPLLSQPERRAAPSAAAAGGARVGRDGEPLPALKDDWWQWLAGTWASVGGRIWSEVRSLVRVTRIDNPEAMLIAPENAWFLRENLKLRLLNARLALLSRQFDIAQSDLRDVQGSLERYFDKGSRRVATTTELVRQVTAQARQMSLPRPDETLAAIAAAQSGR